MCINSVLPFSIFDVPGHTAVLHHDVDASPVKEHPYHINPHKRGIKKAEVEFLLWHGLAESSKSPWSSPCLLVPKPYSTFRFCTDYRRVNSLTKADSFLLPHIDDCVDRVGAASFVTKLDLLKGYWQVQLTPNASEIFAFIMPEKFLQDTVLAFAMRNAPATFQRLVQKVLKGISNWEPLLDDIILCTNCWEDHIKTLQEVCARLSDASLTLNLAKCEFAKAEITCIGKKVGRGSMKPVEAKVSAVLKFPAHTKKRDERRFFGMCGYYRGFCRNFSNRSSWQ